MEVKQCVILAGGQGSRLGNLTKKCPKPLVKIKGKPFLFYLKLMPEDKIESVMGKEIKTNEILMDQGVIDSLRKFERES